MKKLFFLICMTLISATSFAQAGKCTFGVHGNYLLDSPNNFGLGANVGYEFIDNVRGVAEFNYLFKAKDTSYWNLEVNAEYLFQLNDKLTIYPLAGLDVTGWKNGGSDSKLGLNIGAGVEYAVSESVSLKAEYNYKTQWDGFSWLKFGVVIPF